MEPTPHPETLQPSRLDGINTHWSLIREAHAGGLPQSATLARQALVLRYAKSVRRYIGGIVRNSEDADELAQDAVMRLMKGDFGGADPHRGRFRDFLKTAVRNMVRSHWQKSNRRRGADVELDALAGADDERDALWEEEFQSNVLDQAWAVLREFERRTPTNPAYSIMKLRTEFPEATSDELADKLGVKLGKPVRADAGRQILRRARLRFAEALVDEIGSGLAEPTPENVAEELAQLGLLDHVREFLPKDWSRGAGLNVS